MGSNQNIKIRLTGNSISEEKISESKQRRPAGSACAVQIYM